MKMYNKNKYQVGSEMIYHECGISGRVLILSCNHVKLGDSPVTKVRLRALENLGGPSIANPIKAGHEWDVTEADNAGSYTGWFLYPTNTDNREDNDR